MITIHIADTPNAENTTIKIQKIPHQKMSVEQCEKEGEQLGQYIYTYLPAITVKAMIAYIKRLEEGLI